MKKLIALMTILCAANAWCDWNFTDYSDHSVLFNGVNEPYVTVPSTHYGLPVTQIEGNAFYGCDNVVSVEIPDSVMKIGAYTFDQCSALNRIIIGSGVRTLSHGVFRGCSRLRSITFRGNAPWLGDKVFEGVPTDCIVYVDKTATGFDEDASGRWCGLKLERNLLPPDFTVKNGVLTSVSLNGNSEVVIPTDVTAIGYQAFMGLDHLERVTIPNSVMDIGVMAFYECHNLTNVTIPDSVTNIGNSAFCFCSSLRWLTLPEGLLHIGNDVFYACPAYELNRYLAVINYRDPRYALATSQTDRAIASVTITGDTALDSFVLSDGKVYDTVLYVTNSSSSDATVTLPDGYEYVTFAGAEPLRIPAGSRNMLTVTRIDGTTFLVSRQALQTIGK